MAMLIDSRNGNSPTPPTQVLPDPNSFWLNPLNLGQSDEDALIGGLVEQRTRAGSELNRGQSNKSLSLSIPKPRRPSRAYISRDNVSSYRARHLERNRLAANKCRLRKKKDNEQMQSILNNETARRQMLLAEVNVLKEELWHLKNSVFAHANCDDQSINAYLALMSQTVLGASPSVLKCPSPTFTISTPSSHSAAGIYPGVAEDESNIADDYSLKDLFEGFIDTLSL